MLDDCPPLGLKYFFFKPAVSLYPQFLDGLSGDAPTRPDRRLEEDYCTIRQRPC